jgi:hypothetical protein
MNEPVFHGEPGIDAIESGPQTAHSSNHAASNGKPNTNGQAATQASHRETTIGDEPGAYVPEPKKDTAASAAVGAGAAKTAAQIENEAFRASALEKIPGAIKNGPSLLDKEWGALGHVEANWARVKGNFTGKALEGWGKGIVFARGVGVTVGAVGFLRGTWQAIKGFTGAEKIDPETGKTTKADMNDALKGTAWALGSGAIALASALAGGKGKFVLPSH